MALDEETKVDVIKQSNKDLAAAAAVAAVAAAEPAAEPEPEPEPERD